MSLCTFAPAKLNLFLHITGQRENGYHELDSLVAFCDVGDEVRLEPAPAFDLAIEGPLALSLAQEPIHNNLIAKAARLLSEEVGRALKVKFTLVKNLPIASGIGGGSSDAAAALRLLAQHWEIHPDDPVLYAVARKLGQDIPCCIKSETCQFRGIGDEVVPGPVLPFVHAVLVNPHRALPTPSVYKARTGEFSMAAPFTKAPKDLDALIGMLKERNNDLTDAACSLVPDIKHVLLAIDTTPNCLLSRMSGSGATCFGLFTDRGSARAAASRIFASHPDWWVTACSLPYLPRED